MKEGKIQREEILPVRIRLAHTVLVMARPDGAIPREESKRQLHKELIIFYNTISILHK